MRQTDSTFGSRLAVSLAYCVLVWAFDASTLLSADQIATVRSVVQPHTDFARYLKIWKIDGKRAGITIEGRTARAGIKYQCSVCELSPGARSVTVVYLWDTPDQSGTEAIHEVFGTAVLNIFTWGWFLPFGLGYNAMDSACVGTLMLDVADGLQYGIDITHNAPNEVPGDLRVINLLSGEILGTAKCEPPVPEDR